jgi:antitoxin MazE
MNNSSRLTAMKKIMPIPSSLQIQSHLISWGDDLGVQITPLMAKISGMTADSRVTVTAKPGRIIIETTPKKVTLEEMLAKFDPVRHGGESMAYAPVGQELLQCKSTYISD